MTAEFFNLDFEGITEQLKSHILRIMASFDDAEDIVHDTYIKVLDKLHTFRGESTLKTWLFTIASNLAKDNLRAQRRWVDNVTDITKKAALSNKEFLNRPLVELSTLALAQLR